MNHIKMPKISALVHTYNEEHNVRACLETVKWADEIVVVDMYSSDKTVEICKEYTDKIFYFERSGIVEPARQFGIEQTIFPWVLVVDADERIPFNLYKKLIEISQNDSADVVKIPSQNHFLGKHIKYTGFYPDYHPRFFKRKAVTTSKEVHAPFTITGRITELDSEKYWIAHFGYTNSHHFVEKLNNYTNFEAEKLYNANARISTSRILKKGLYAFRKRYISQKGYKDGFHGLVISLLRGFYDLLKWIKYWELKNMPLKKVEETYRAYEQEIIEQYTKNSVEK